MIVILLFILSYAGASAQISTSGLVAFYPFKNNTLDSSENHFSAIAAGCTFTADRFGNANSALEMDGVDDLLILPLPGFTPLNEDFSISFWLKTTSPEKLNLFSLKETPFATVDNFEIRLTRAVTCKQFLICIMATTLN